ncbi:amino acid transporter heavy chain SLC3A2-like isoform X2 [Phycodurus eques]|uniref:amino acid transporter heavy chain SLC3A2-like isoform X2 n=1 Tax=Phycodurus eques TaxID=693459 RepID=UPI002ACD2CF0|nr:amino acid transporter heavy chain SLC3A2-like isoform X2 [Phycodurus eques]
MDQNPDRDRQAVEEDAPAPKRPEARRDEAADADATEADVSEVVLDQQDVDDNSQKQPMTGGGGADAAEGEQPEKNGCVKLKMDDDDEFTGLNKEELLRVAGTPGWVRTRWALLVLFWLGWLGMLAGAALLILQAPRCRDLPAAHWWNRGALYRVPSVRAFTDAGDIKGVSEKVDALSQLKFSGLVLGPVHVAPPDDAAALRLREIAVEAGSLEQFKDLLRVAHRKGMSVVLDLTPNYRGSSGSWFSDVSVTVVAEELKSALVFWFSEGVDGVQLADVDHVAAAVPSLWADIRAVVQNGTDGRPARRLLMGVTERHAATDVSAILSSTGVDLLTSGLLLDGDASELARSVRDLYAAHAQTRLAWNLGGRGRGHLASLVGPALVPLYQLLLFTLPGTPVLEYGDEIGLTDDGTKFPRMIWDSPEDELNGTLKEARARRTSSRAFLRSVSDARAKERSLLFGDFVPLANSSSSLAFVRSWDQNARFLAAFNFDPREARLEPSHPTLPPLAEVVLAAAPGAAPKAGARVDPAGLRLGGGEAVLLKFPFAG